MENFWEHLQNLTDAQSIISKGGFLLLLVVVFAETGLFFGFFLPGDYLLFMAGLLCASGIFDVNIYILIISLIIAGILGRFLPIIRTFAPIFAGVVKVDIKKFTLYNIIGSVAWVMALCLSGYFLGIKYPEVRHYVQYIIIGFFVVTSVPLIYAFLKKRTIKQSTG